MEEKPRKAKQYALRIIFAVIVVAIIIYTLFHGINCRPVPAYKFACMSKLRTLVVACYVYKYNNNEHWPALDKWCDIIKPCFEENERNTFQCPKDKIGPCSYAMNENIPAEATDLPQDLVLLFESAPGWNQVGGPEDVVTDRHDKPGANIAFGDTRVRFVSAEDIPKLRWTK